MVPRVLHKIFREIGHENILIVAKQVDIKLQIKSSQTSCTMDSLSTVSYVANIHTMKNTQAHGRFHLYCCFDGFIYSPAHYDQCSIVQSSLVYDLE